MAKENVVALIEPVGGHGGMDHYDLGLSEALIDAQWSVSWYTCRETSPPPPRNGLNFRPVYRGIWGTSSKRLRAARYLRGILEALIGATKAGEKICHLHFFHGSPEELMTLALAKLFRRRVVVTVHDVESFADSEPSQRWSVRTSYRWVDRFIVHNLVSKTALNASLAVPVEKISIIPHGNYLATVQCKLSLKEAKSLLQIDPARKVVLFFGQIKEVKGLDLLLEAFVRVVEQIPEATLLIAGRPWKNDFARYQQMIDELGIHEHCKLHIRFIPNEEVELYYTAAEVVVLPYRRIYQSGVILLSMSYQRAVLVSDLPGMTEIVTDSDNGYVFESGSVPRLSGALIRVLQDDEGRERVAKRGHEFVVTHHDWRKIGRQTVLVYQTVT